jgi:hypothetical protein
VSYVAGIRNHSITDSAGCLAMRYLSVGGLRYLQDQVAGFAFTTRKVNYFVGAHAGSLMRKGNWTREAKPEIKRKFAVQTRLSIESRPDLIRSSLNHTISGD